MKHWSSWFRSVLAGIALIAGFGLFSTQALAQLTPSNTDITNQATLAYSSGTGGGAVAQPNISSNITTFKVDKLVRLLVAELGGSPTTATPNTLFSAGGAGNVTTFTVTNQGNDPQGYVLAGVATAAGSVQLPPGGTTYTNSITPAINCSTFVDGNANGTYQFAGDTAIAIPTLAPGASATVFVVCDIPSTAANPTVVNGAIAVTELVATTANNATCAANGTGCVVTSTAGSTPLSSVDNFTLVDTVFGDIVAGSAAGDALRDGKHSARDAFVIASATITVVKTQSVLCDTANFAGNGTTIFPRALPGAYIQYKITITNTNLVGASATLTTITDALQTANVTMDPNLVTATAAACPSTAESAAGSGFKLTCTNGTRACVATPRYFTTTSSADGIDYALPTITANFGVGQLLPVEAGYLVGELKPTEAAVITYNVIIK